MLIDWLPQALKRYYQATPHSSPRRQVRRSTELFVFQIETLEERQLLSAANSYNVPAPSPYDNIAPVLMQIASTATPTSGSGAVTNAVNPGGGNSGPSTVTETTADYVARDKFGRVGVRIISANVNGLQSALTSLGFVATGSRPDLNFVEGFIPQSKIAQLGNLSNSGLLGVVPLYAAITRAGPTDNQALSNMGVDRTLATAPGYDGTGVRIGVISDSFNSSGPSNLPAYQNGDLPSSVQVLLEGPFASSDEGRAMAELIHDVAPGAAISFASGFYGQASFAQQIRNLANPAIGRADIIVDDLIYFDEPMFQDGVIAQAVNDVVNFNGVAYFSAAGNDASNSYENTSPNFAVDLTFGPGQYLDFDPSANVDTRNRIFLNNGESIALELQWDDPFYTTNGVNTDVDIFVVEVSTGQIVASSTSNNIATQTPSEFLAAQAFGSGAYDVIVRLESPLATAPGRVKWVDFGSHFGSFQFDTQSSTVYGHAAAKGAMSVAAAPYYDPQNIESFSSQGGSTILFNPTGAPLGTPDVRQTPSITAIDGTNTSFFTGDFLFAFGGDVESDGLPNFFGTSAAAPHAAAIAALIKQANPGLSPQQIYDRITSTATDIGASGVDNFTGAGLINAFAAIYGMPIQGGLGFVDSFETGALTGFWETSVEGNGLITVDSTRGATDGSKSLTLGSRFTDLNSGFYAFDGSTQATLNLDLSGVTDDIFLSFDSKQSISPTATSFSSGEDPMSDFFIDSEQSDGVAISVDGGVIWRKLVSLTGSQIGPTFENHKINLTQLANNGGFSLENGVLIRFQQYDQFFAPNPITIDNVQVFTTQPPTVTLDPATLDYAIGSPAKIIDANAMILDTQTTNYEGGSLKVAVTQNGTASDLIEIRNQALIPNRTPTVNDISLVNNRVLYNAVQIGTFVGGTGVSPLIITFNSNSTLTAVRFLLRDITFRTQSTSLQTRTVSVTLNNGTGAGQPATRQINVLPAANVAPIIATTTPSALNVQPGTTANVIDATLTVTDTDSQNFEGGVLTIKIATNASSSTDRIEIKNQGSGTGQIGFSGSTIKYQGTTIGTLSGGTISRTITLNSAATPVAVQALLRTVTFRTTSTSAPLGTRSVQYQLSDGDGGTSLIFTKLINVVKKNQSPVIGGITATIPIFYLGKTPVIIEPSATITDADTSNFNGGSLTVKITTNANTFDKLRVRNQGSNIGQIAISGNTTVLYGGIAIGTISGGLNGTALVITFNSNANAAAVRALTRNITFETSGTIPSLAQRTISFQLNDGLGGVSTAVTKFVKVSKP